MAKKMTNDEKIIAAMDAIDKSVRSLQKFGAKYDSYIDAAILRNDDARAKQLIMQKHKVYQLAEQLGTLKSNIELGAFTASALSELDKLPAAISGCKGLLAESPDFAKLGKSMKSIFKDINASEQELAKFNSIMDDALATGTKPTIASRLDGSDEEDTDWFKAEMASAMERVKGVVGSTTVAKPETEAAATGDIDYAGIVAEENKKK